MHSNTVYLIDDEPELLALLTDIVKMEGLTPKGFDRANLFFQQADALEPGALLVLDLHMPEMDGIEVMRRLAEMPQPPALILISGHDRGVLHAAEKLGKAHKLDIIASLNKPVPTDHFRHLLKDHVSGLTAEQIRASHPVERDVSISELHDAIHNDQLTLHYQPQYEIASRTLSGVEALVRWHHPEQGLIYPDRFIQLAEETGWMGAITHWVIDRAVRQEQQWQNANLPINVSVNISAMDITSLTLPEQLGELLTANLLDPTRLTLEVTESALMGELVTSLDILTRLRLRGVGLSIDDFGTGYSSLSQLHRVPFTELKIDRSFVSNMTEDKEARAIVKTCIMLGHELNMQVVAEGVETEEHLALLSEMGCDRGQGYLFGKPVPPEQIEQEFLRKTSTLAP
ncbi:MAG: EAL domain-containing response regulator [Gammaproteobacteria bacterium]